MSKIVHIEATEDTPSILLDPVKNEIRIKGISMPENAFEFYDPIEKKALEIFKKHESSFINRDRIVLHEFHVKQTSIN